MAYHVVAMVVELLYALPPELRNMIYEETFFSNGRCIDTSQDSATTRPNLFAASKLFYQEAASYFYTNGIFIMDGTYVSWGDATVLPPVADEYVTHLRRIDLRIKTGRTQFAEVQQAAKTIAGLGKAYLTAGNMFEEVDIRIDLPIGVTTSLSREFDDATMEHDHCITEALLGVLTKPAAKTLRIHLGEEVGFATGVAQSLLHAFEAYPTDTSLQVNMTQDGQQVLVTKAEDCERRLSGKYNSLTDEEIAQCEDGSAPAEMILRTLGCAPVDFGMKEICLDLDVYDIDMDIEEMSPVANEAEWRGYEEMILFTPELL